ncbi:MAG TPA: hypothetical protein VM639_13240 [Dongiaceae bacterium]|nr:hypothetical protein [Dongiaceae bacterium]
MSRATMYQQPLERYLLSKMHGDLPCRIDDVRIRRLEAGEGGCNWDIAKIEPPLPAEWVAQLEREVIAPVRATINLAD